MRRDESSTLWQDGYSIEMFDLNAAALLTEHSKIGKLFQKGAWLLIAELAHRVPRIWILSNRRTETLLWKPT